MMASAISCSSRRLAVGVSSSWTDMPSSSSPDGPERVGRGLVGVGEVAVGVGGHDGLPDGVQHLALDGALLEHDGHGRSIDRLRAEHDGLGARPSRNESNAPCRTTRRSLRRPASG